MIENKKMSSIITEIHCKEFQVIIKFHAKGAISGNFIKIIKPIPSVYPLINGFFFQEDNDINFTFFVDWFRSADISTSSCFIGSYKTRDDTYSLKWLTTYDCSNSEYNFTKSGSLSDSRIIAGEVPYPSINFKVCLHPTGHVNMSIKWDIILSKITGNHSFIKNLIGEITEVEKNCGALNALRFFSNSIYQ